MSPFLSDGDHGELILERNKSELSRITEQRMPMKSTTSIAVNRIYLENTTKANARKTRQKMKFNPVKTQGMLRHNTIGTKYRRIMGSKYGKSLSMISELSVNASDIAKSKFCVSSEDGQKLYHSIRSVLLDGKKARVSFEGIQDISSAFLDEAISNLYNGEFDEEELKQKVNYVGLDQGDLHLLENIIEWAKEDFSIRV